MTRFVCPTPPELRAALTGFDRLYAFPVEPEAPAPDRFVLLDSGAFGLAKRGQYIDLAHMLKLSAHYRAHCASSVHGIAPDVYLDPRQTLDNWRIWHHEMFLGRVVPVIQFEHKREWSLLPVKLQCAQYAINAPHPFVCISNPGSRAAEVPADTVRAVIDMARTMLGATWVHNLGAGWDIDDVRRWGTLGFDSIDTIAYYTAAKAGESWDGLDSDTDWRHTAIRNAFAAAAVLGGQG